MKDKLFITLTIKIGRRNAGKDSPLLLGNMIDSANSRAKPIAYRSRPDDRQLLERDQSETVTLERK
jgi:hypothetical protein